MERRSRKISVVNKNAEPLSEAEISMILDTFMYMEYKEAREGTSLREILADLENHPDYGGGGIHYGEYTVLKEAAAIKEIGDLEIGYQSANMGYDTGTAACTFRTPDQETVYVVYRGTGDGEWPDNGLGMTQAATTQQKQALAYFEEVVADMGITKEQRLIVTGHSKGGNKAQFVTMETKYGELLDACYSVDGQGFSEAAIATWQKRYGQAGYQQRTEKIYGIHGENDYVSVLGNSIIPEDQIRYIKTPVEKENFPGYHDVKYMFASLEYDEETGEYVTVFHGRKNMDAGGRGELGEYAFRLSEEIMKLPAGKRDGCAAVVMQLMEMTSGSHKGINGEKLSIFDVLDFLFAGLPVIADSLLEKEAGKDLIQAFLKAASFGDQLPAGVSFKADPAALKEQAGLLGDAAQVIGRLAEEIRSASNHIPGYLKGGTALFCQLRLSVGRLEQFSKELIKISKVKEQSAQIYQKWELQAIEEVQGMIDFS